MVSKALNALDKIVMSKRYPSIFFEVNRLLQEVIQAEVPVVMIDMPEILLRM